MTCMTGVPNSALNSGEGANRPVKELLYVQFSGRFEILVPKIRGTGYLKTPLGHHENDLRTAPDHPHGDGAGRGAGGIWSRHV